MFSLKSWVRRWQTAHRLPRTPLSRRPARARLGLESLETRDTPAPLVQITGAPSNSPEGTAVTLGSTITDPGGTGPYTYAWTVTKNGSAYATGTPTNGPTFTFTPDDNGTFDVGLTVTAPDGQTATATGPTDVLIIYDDANAPGTTALRNALVAAGFNVALSTSSETLYTGNNPSLTTYEAVIHLDGTTYSTPMPTSGQQALANYVQNGGAYLGSEWLSYEAGSHPFLRDLILFDYNGFAYDTVTYTDAVGQSDHPILAMCRHRSRSTAVGRSRPRTRSRPTR